MKIRTDFVTNSSSASYILTFKVPPRVGKEDVLDYLLNNYNLKYSDCRDKMKEFVEQGSLRDDIKETDSPQIFKWESYTSMHNCHIEDVPKRMQEFVWLLLSKDAPEGWEFCLFEREDD